MATSGIYDFNMTANEIIQDALEHLGVALPNEAPNPNPDDFRSSMRSLRMMIKAWQAEGIGLWLNQRVVVFPVKNPVLGQNLLLGPSGGNACPFSSFVESTLAADAGQGDISIQLASVAGFLDGQSVGIELSDGSMQWTTVSGDPVGSSIILASPLSSGSVIGNVVYAYSEKMQRPKGIVEPALRRDYNSRTEIPLRIVSRDEYMSLPLKSSVGPVNQVYLDPQLINAELYIWPTTDSVRTVLFLTVRRPVQDFSLAGTDDCDFPDEWAEALSYNLALRLATKFSVPDSVYNRVLRMADRTKEELEGFDAEDSSIYLTVAARQK